MGKGGTIPRAPKFPNDITSIFFNTVHLLPKDLRFEHGGAKLVSCPMHHLTSLRPAPTATPATTEKVFQSLQTFSVLNDIALDKFYSNHLC